MCGKESESLKCLCNPQLSRKNQVLWISPSSRPDLGGREGTLILYALYVVGRSETL